MKQRTATRKRSAAMGIVRSGRPPRTLASEVEERILDAAVKVFLERGFEGASVDEIADVARAGKPTIYARFPGKEALFTAIMGGAACGNFTSSLEEDCANGGNYRGASGEHRQGHPAEGPGGRYGRLGPSGRCRSTPVSGSGGQRQSDGA